MKSFLKTYSKGGLYACLFLIVIGFVAMAGHGPAAAALGLLPFVFGGIAVRDDMDEVRTLKFAHTAATVKDTIYMINGMPMLALNSSDANVVNVFVISGLIEYAKVSAQAWTSGQRVYYDTANARFTNVQGAATILAGFTGDTAANPTSTGIVILIPKIGQVKTRTVVALTDAAATLTATQLIDSGIFTITPSAGRALTVDTAALIVAGFPGAQVGDYFDFNVVCLAAFAATITTAANITLVGSMAVNNQSATFRAVCTNVTAASEAVTIYRVS